MGTKLPVAIASTPVEIKKLDPPAETQADSSKEFFSLKFDSEEEDDAAAPAPTANEKGAEAPKDNSIHSEDMQND